MIDFEPTDEQKLIVESVRPFAAHEIRPRARECDEVGKLPDDVLSQAHELGLIAYALPRLPVEHAAPAKRTAGHADGPSARSA